MKITDETSQTYRQKVALSRRRLQYFTVAQQERLKMNLGQDFDLEMLAHLDGYLASISKPSFQIKALSKPVLLNKQDSFLQTVNKAIK